MSSGGTGKRPIQVFTQGRLSMAVFYDEVEGRYPVNLRKSLSREVMAMRGADFPPESILIHEDDLPDLAKLCLQVNAYIAEHKTTPQP
jgi:hypothetical protein